MNRFLTDILAQPETLQLVLTDLTGSKRASLDQASTMINNAQRIVITSMGSALFSSMPMHSVLKRTHPNVHFEETSDLLFETPFFKQTLYIIMSRSGESGEIAAFSQQIRAEGGKLMAITMTPDSTLAQNADLVIHDIASYDGLICTKAFTSLMLCGLLIAFHVVKLVDKTLISTLAHRIGALENTYQQITEFFNENSAALDTPVPYFLSRGVGMSIARAGALYMHEGALLPAVADSIGMFHHGPMELAEQGFTTLWIDPNPDVYSLNLFGRVLSQGATVIPISVNNDSYSQGLLFPWSNVPAPFRCLPAAMVVQLYTWWLANSRGHEAGEMKHLQWLIT